MVAGLYINIAMGGPLSRSRFICTFGSVRQCSPIAKSTKHPRLGTSKAYKTGFFLSDPSTHNQYSIPIGPFPPKAEQTKKGINARQLPKPTSILNSHLSITKKKKKRKKKKQTPAVIACPGSAYRDKDKMVQGKVKGMKTSKQKAIRSASSSSTTRKGKRYVAPKKAGEIKIASLKKVRIADLYRFLFLLFLSLFQLC
jgi:hypothetical protein